MRQHVRKKQRHFHIAAQIGDCVISVPYYREQIVVVALAPPILHCDFHCFVAGLGRLFVCYCPINDLKKECKNGYSSVNVHNRSLLVEFLQKQVFLLQNLSKVEVAIVLIRENAFQSNATANVDEVDVNLKK